MVQTLGVKQNVTHLSKTAGAHSLTVADDDVAIGSQRLLVSFLLGFGNGSAATTPRMKPAQSGDHGHLREV